MEKSPQKQKPELFDYDIGGIKETAKFAVQDWKMKQDLNRQLAYAERAYELGDTEYVLYFDTIDDLSASDLLVALKKEMDL